MVRNKRAEIKLRNFLEKNTNTQGLSLLKSISVELLNFTQGRKFKDDLSLLEVEFDV